MPTTATYLGYPFDQELFMQMWNAEPDPVKLAMINSGAMVDDALIASRLTTDGNFYTIPFYNTLDGTEVNYDGQTDITGGETTGISQSGIVYGRAMAHTARNFVAELSGSDPMRHIASSIARLWSKKRQKRLIGLMEAIFGITGDTEWAARTILVGGPIGATTLNDAATDTLGDNKSAYSLVVMHSSVARVLENLQVLEYWKYTDANGVQRPTNIASANGYTVIVDDDVPMTAAAGENPATYTSYLLGAGSIRFAQARLDVPAEVERTPAKNGGQDTLYTRIRETIHPNGFSFVVPGTGWTESPTDAQLTAAANWKRIFKAKAIPMAKIVTTGVVTP